MFQDTAHAATPWPFERTQETPLPVLLMLQPMMSGEPWAELVARVVGTVQVHDVAADPVSAGVQATIDDAIYRQCIQAVLVCCEGPHTLVRHAELAARTRKVAAAVRASASRSSRRATVGALWFDPEKEHVSLFTVHPTRMAFQETAPEGALYHALLDAMSLGLPPWVRRREPS